MADITYDILKNYGVLSEEKNGWRKELSLVSWNGRNPKLDLRDWAPDHQKMGKGITLTHDEALKLQEFLTAALEEN
ncbi:hypothetical protein AGMMS49944_29800 [Spirochaetia bacterium]|nr:hypothetical protein AGMMS49944_29800 [Spirochaetia bacterium]